MASLEKRDAKRLGRLNALGELLDGNDFGDVLATGSGDLLKLNKPGDNCGGQREIWNGRSTVTVEQLPGRSLMKVMNRLGKADSTEFSGFPISKVLSELFEFSIQLSLVRDVSGVTNSLSSCLG